ncbi:MAG: methyltransferase domain-containing protein [Hyphomicrobiaceae bacterium]|nr:MAG: methyltransferase domain-containing protein [Hyphomicrobiaceae bacterium]
MDKDRVKAFAEKVYADMAGTMAVGMAYVGVKTGLFRAMEGKGAMRAGEVVAAAELQSRYVEEWLKGMTAAGYLHYDATADSYRLPDEHAFLLASEGTDHFMGGLFYFAPTLLRVAPNVAEAFRTGGGVKFEEFGSEGVVALDMINSGQYENRLASHWLTKLPDIAERLQSGGRVLDVGCGVGRVGMAIAKTFPKCEVIGLDPDAETIRQAQAAATKAGLGGRMQFVAKTTDTLERGAGFDLITACDCVHDFSAPGKTLAELRHLVKPDGALFIVEPKAADDLQDNINPIAAMYYGMSIFHCMTQSLADGGPGLGTCLGPRRTMELLRTAGFEKVQLLDIRSQTNLFYAARP